MAGLALEKRRHVTANGAALVLIVVAALQTNVLFVGDIHRHTLFQLSDLQNDRQREKEKGKSSPPASLDRWNDARSRSTAQLAPLGNAKKFASSAKMQIQISNNIQQHACHPPLREDELKAGTGTVRSRNRSASTFTFLSALFLDL